VEFFSSWFTSSFGLWVSGCRYRISALRKLDYDYDSPARPFFGRSCAAFFCKRLHHRPYHPSLLVVSSHHGKSDISPRLLRCIIALRLASQGDLLESC
jgi:hypothetical protein